MSMSMLNVRMGGQNRKPIGKMININREALGFGNNVGFVNQVISLFTFVLWAIKNNIDFINLDSINWTLSWKNRSYVNHNKIFDVNFWNSNAKKYNFPRLVRNNNTYEMVTVPEIPHDFFWDHSNFLNADNTNSINFSYLLKPVKSLLNIINEIKPESYGTIHFRVENDLKVINGWYEARLNIKKTYDKIKDNVKNVPKYVYACVAKQDVTDEYCLEIFNNKISPWENVSLVFGGSEACKKYNVCEKYHHLIGAIIDYYVAIDSTHFFCGHYKMSTFTRSISIIRNRKNKLNIHY